MMMMMLLMMMIMMMMMMMLLDDVGHIVASDDWVVMTTLFYLWKTRDTKMVDGEQATASEGSLHQLSDVRTRSRRLTLRLTDMMSLNSIMIELLS